MASAGPAAADFSCSICFDTATEPVVTRCGHLFCWDCLEHWLHSAAGGPECPMCKGRVDEHVSGDIIPLYGKGRQAAKSTGGHSAGPASTAPATTAAAARTTTTTTTTTTHTTTTVDPGQEAFFSSPTAYSYAPARETRRATEAAGAVSGPAQPPQAAAPPEHRPRPSADRAPPRPRPPNPQQQYPNVQLHRGGVPLTMGSGIFFFGGGTGMFFSLIVIAIWAVYQYAPLRDWARTARQWFDRRHGIAEEPEAAARHEHDAPPAAAPRSPHATPPTTAPSSGSPADPDAPPASVQQLMIGLVVMFVLLQLLVYV